MSSSCFDMQAAAGRSGHGHLMRGDLTYQVSLHRSSGVALRVPQRHCLGEGPKGTELITFLEQISSFQVIRLDVRYDDCDHHGLRGSHRDHVQLERTISEQQFMYLRLLCTYPSSHHTTIRVPHDYPSDKDHPISSPTPSSPPHSSYSPTQPQTAQSSFPQQ